MFRVDTFLIPAGMSDGFPGLNWSYIFLEHNTMKISLFKDPVDINISPLGRGMGGHNPASRNYINFIGERFAE